MSPGRIRDLKRRNESGDERVLNSLHSFKTSMENHKAQIYRLKDLLYRTMHRYHFGRHEAASLTWLCTPCSSGGLQQDNILTSRLVQMHMVEGDVPIALPMSSKDLVITYLVNIRPGRRTHQRQPERRAPWVSSTR
jgi:hypothetical protein